MSTARAGPSSLAALVALSLAIGSAAEPGYRFLAVPVLEAVDGDTLAVYLPGVHPLWGDRALVRLRGIDAPEMRGQCPEEKAAARAARDRLAGLVAGERVDLEDCELGKFGRPVCSVRAGLDVAEQLVREGHARRYDGGAREGWCSE